MRQASDLLFLWAQFALYTPEEEKSDPLTRVLRQGATQTLAKHFDGAHAFGAASLCYRRDHENGAYASSDARGGIAYA